MLHTVKANDIAWVAESASQFSHWLVHEAEGKTWTEENIQLPGMYRWTVDWISYEKLFTWLWPEPWFQEGMRAFGLIALEQEGKIQLFQSQKECALFVKCPDGTLFGIHDFLNGESLEIRHDPDFADLSWDPVSSICHVLSEYADSY